MGSGWSLGWGEDGVRFGLDKVGTWIRRGRVESS